MKKQKNNRKQMLVIQPGLELAEDYPKITFVTTHTKTYTKGYLFERLKTVRSLFAIRL